MVEVIERLAENGSITPRIASRFIEGIRLFTERSPSVPTATQEQRTHDWTEDFAHENGRYINCCNQCAATFVWLQNNGLDGFRMVGDYLQFGTADLRRTVDASMADAARVQGENSQ